MASVHADAADRPGTIDRSEMTTRQLRNRTPLFVAIVLGGLPTTVATAEGLGYRFRVGQRISYGVELGFSRRLAQMNVQRTRLDLEVTSVADDGTATMRWSSVPFDSAGPTERDRYDTRLEMAISMRDTGNPIPPQIRAQYEPKTSTTDSSARSATTPPPPTLSTGSPFLDDLRRRGEERFERQRRALAASEVQILKVFASIYRLSSGTMKVDSSGALSFLDEAKGPPDTFLQGLPFAYLPRDLAYDRPIGRKSFLRTVDGGDEVDEADDIGDGGAIRGSNLVTLTRRKSSRPGEDRLITDGEMTFDSRQPDPPRALVAGEFHFSQPLGRVVRGDLRMALLFDLSTGTADTSSIESPDLRLVLADLRGWRRGLFDAWLRPLPDALDVDRLPRPSGEVRELWSAAAENRPLRPRSGSRSRRGRPRRNGTDDKPPKIHASTYHRIAPPPPGDDITAAVWNAAADPEHPAADDLKKLLSRWRTLYIAATRVPRTWTSDDGRGITAQLVASEGSAVRLRKSDGSTVSVPLDRLSDADREIVETFALSDEQRKRWRIPGVRE